jgi:GNAT superfamily N-acetyltransferase
VPLLWQPDVDGWSEDGWNWAVKKAFEDRDAGREPCAQCGLSITIAAAHRGKGFGKKMVQVMREIAQSKGLAAVIVPLRPSLKSLYPLAPMEDYIEWKGSDGRPFDPWIRAHTEAGAQVIGVCPRSALISGTVTDWEEWTKMSFPASGFYTVPGALVPMEVDVSSGQGYYVEPNVWIYHKLC